MKPFGLIATLIFLASTISGSAQDRWGDVPNAYDDETVIYAVVDVEAEQFNLNDYELAAFVDGELRYKGYCIEFQYDDESLHYWAMRVKGTADDQGRDISFRLYDHGTDLEYRFTPTATYTYSGTIGTPSLPYVLELVPVASILPEYYQSPDSTYINTTLTIERGDTIELPLTILPENHTPVIPSWTNGDNSRLEVLDDGLSITGLRSSARKDGQYVPIELYSCLGSAFYGFDVIVLPREGEAEPEEIVIADSFPKAIAKYERFVIDRYVSVLPDEADQKIKVEVMNGSDSNLAWEAQGWTFVGNVTGTHTLKISSEADSDVYAMATIEVSVELTSVVVNGNQALRCALGDSVAIELTPVPADALIDYSAVQYNIRSLNALSGDPGNEVTMDESGNAYFKPNSLAASEITVTYNGATFATARAEGGIAYDLSQGWNWMSLPGESAHSDSSLHASQSIAGWMGDNLVEARSKTTLLYNDPELGYFGDMLDQGDHFMSNTLYKVKLADDVASVYYSDAAPQSQSLTVEVANGWTWIGYPLPHAYRPSTVLPMATPGFQPDDVIKSKDGAFVAVDSLGQWEGSIKLLEPGMGYMLYHEGEPYTLTWPAYDLLPMNDEEAAQEEDEEEDELLSYDIHRYIDCMALLLKIENLATPERYIIGAYVDGECRGKGTMVNGLWYVGVQGEMGDEIHLSLIDRFTGEATDIEEPVDYAPKAGTRNAPVTRSLDGTEMLDDQAQPKVWVDGSTVLSTAPSLRVFNLYGRDVTALNGRLTQGVYLAAPDGYKAQKVVIK
ncbi:MAG: hypothetical protein LIP02_03760 [Bacteroidales bacterium]|nr:hypothetical protein [Bacteroidales bacterium]